MTRRFPAIAALLVLHIALAACIAMQAPKTFKQQLAYGYALRETVINTTISLLQRDRISVARAREIRSLVVDATTSLDLARDSSVPATATEALQSALNILTKLETELNERGSP